jgi:AcrR family transcriptional regulator
MLERPEELQARILDHAGAKFTAYGFSRTTMEEISRELGISKKTLYRHFAAKQDLLRAVIRKRLEEVKSKLDRLFNTPGLPFRVRFDGLLRLVGAQLSLIRYPLINDLYRYAPRIWQEIDEFRSKQVFSRLEKLFRQGIEEGYIRADVDPRLTVFLISRVAQSVINPELLVGLGLSPPEVYEALIALVRYGVFTDKGRRESGRLEGTGRSGLIDQEKSDV